MQNLFKHIAWAAAFAGSVGMAASHDWTPFHFRISSHETNAPDRPPQASQANAPGTAPQLPTNLAAMQAPAPVAIAPEPPALANIASIDDPAAAAQILSAINQLEGILDAPDGIDIRKTVVAFFDPRCRFCHAAFAAMKGKIATRWIPVIALENPDQGIALASSILAAPDRLSAMKQAFDGTLPPVADPTYQQKLANNLQHYASIMAAAKNLQRGVPLFFIPTPDGRVTILVGYEDGNDRKIANILKGVPDG